MTEPQECLALKQCMAKNFYWCIFWGFVVQCIGGSVIAMSHSLTVTVLGWSVYLVGTTILLIGFGFYVKSKGRSPAWCLLALLSLAGWLILILLKGRKSLMLKPGKS
jgi:hypothetical protein